MEVQAVSVADAVADELRRRLLAGHYRGGEQLRDTELSAEFGVARPTLRAAVQMLVADGLLERGRGRSASVRSFTAEDAVDLYRLRRPVELTAVKIVVSGRRPLDGLEAAARDLSSLGEDVTWDVVAAHDVAFHREVFVAAGSPRLRRTFDEISTELRLLIAQLRPSYASIADLAREHELLVATARNGNATQAQSAWSEHFDHSEQFFLGLIRERDL
jgi:DNA-binding GntR family transcriptional regulator